MINIELTILDKRLESVWELPNFKSKSAAGIDLRACIESSLTLASGDCCLISSGIAIYIQDPAYCAMIYPRSGLGHKHGIILGNGVGVIDADYQGEIKISCLNRGPDDYTIEPGARIAQLVFTPIIRPNLIRVDKFSHSSERGGGGFGSTGGH